MKKIPRLLLVVPPWQGLAESLLVCLAILAIVARSESSLARSVYQTGLFFLCGAGGIWAVLRIRMPHAAILRQFFREAATGTGLSLLLLAVLRPLGSLLKWDALWRLSNWDTGSVRFVLGSTGLGYLLARGLVRLWLYWDGLRRRRMLWSLTHAHLTVVVAFAFLSALIVFVISTGASGSLWPQITDPLGSFVSGLLVTFFPALMAIAGLTAVILSLLLPLLAAFSFFVARPTTKRLEALAAATAALRTGNYRARVSVLGGDEVAQLQEDFNAMAGKLETSLAELQAERDTTARALETRRDLVAGVSHELRTPVATLQAAVDTALDGWEFSPPEKIRERMIVMQSEIRRLSGLIDDLFTLSQADVDKLPMECAPLSPAALIDRVVEAFAPLAWKAGRIEVAASLPEILPRVSADARRLQQVLLNLLRNAVTHTPPGGVVAILAGDEGETVRIEIRDTGEGIDPSDLPRIWERFYRGKNADSGGAGLGLALAKELVEAMGGSVAVESILGRGSCFTIRLPVVRPAAD